MDLKPIEKSSLIAGMRLKADVKDENGRLLLTADTVLGPKHLQLLEKMPGDALFVDLDTQEPEQNVEVAEPPTPQDVIEQLEKVQGEKARSAGEFVERRHERKVWNAVLTLVIEEHLDGGYVRHRQVEVTTVDISAGGFAFMHNKAINAETVVRARFEGLPQKPVLIGVVRNCRLVDGKQHRVGVQFQQRAHA